MQLAGLPMTLAWEVDPLDWSVGRDGSLRMVAGARTDLFVDPAGGPAALGAPHASDDGERWELVRHFGFDAPDGLAAGFLVQSPTGEGCTATFDDVRFVAQRLAELRDGS
jgi:hypothetical protein